MRSQESDSELAGKLAASLTAPVVHVDPQRGAQSSGFFDLHTLYTMHVERVRPPPLPVMTRRLPPPIIVHAPIARARSVPRAQPIGWYAVFVAWLAMATLAGIAATQVPAHVTAGRTPTRTATATATPTPTPTATPTSVSVDALPAVAISDLPRALPTAPATHHRRATPPAHAAIAAEGATPEPPPAATLPAKPAVPAAAAPPSTANSSLEDLIRSEVAAEQKRIHAPR